MTKMAKRKLAISINGGGALAVGPLKYLCRLESDMKKSIAKISFAYSGTSTGAIVAACLNEGMSANDILELYLQNLKKIFTKYPWYKRALPSCPTYDNTNLKKILKENLPGMIQSWKKPIYLTTTFMNGDSVEKVWDLQDPKVDKWFAVLTSTAAPTYFDVVEDNGKSYCDGGMWANDPIMTLQAGLVEDGGKDKWKILSLNTGMDVPNTDKGNKTLVGWGEYIMKNWVARAGMSNFFEARANLGYDNVFRASPSVKKPFDMDDVSDKTIQKVMEIWDEQYDKDRKELLEFMKR